VRRCEIRTPAGNFVVLYTTRGVAGLTFPPKPSPGTGTVSPRKRFSERFMRSLPDELMGYFRGERVAFTAPLDLTGLGRFDRRVLVVIRAIPYGETRSYGWVSRRAGSPRGARAVGGACRRNPCPILIPCHRVIGAGGGLGGYSGGVAWKRSLLELEKK